MNLATFVTVPCFTSEDTWRGWPLRRPRARLGGVFAPPARLRACGLALLMALSVTAVRADTLIAVSAPFSGRHADEGKAILKSVEWAVEAINAQGGVAGGPVVLRAEDDGCDDRRTEAAATQIVALAPALVVGHPCAGSARAASRIYAAAGTLFVAAAPRHPDITRRRAGNTIFRLAGRDDLQSASTSAFLAAAYAGKRWAIVHDRTRYARLLVDGLKREHGAAGSAPVAEFGIVASSKDYAATVAGLRASRADVVYFAGFPSEAAALWGQFLPSDAPPDLVGSDALANADAELRAMSGGGRFAARVLRPFTAADSENAKPLLDRLAAAGLPPAASAVAAHAAVEVWAAAVARGGSRDVTAVARQLQAHPLPSVVGDISFDAEGDARVPSFEVATFADGRLTTEAIVLPAERRGHLPPADRASANVAGPRATAVAATEPNAEPARVRQVDHPVATDRAPPLPVRHPRRRLRPRS